MSDVDLARLARHWNCRLTVPGRRSGRPRTVTMWFAPDPDAGCVYLTGSGKPPHWVRNVAAHEAAGGAVTLEIGDVRLCGRARQVTDPAAVEAIRRRFARRYLAARLARALGTGYVDSTAVVVDELAPAGQGQASG